MYLKRILTYSILTLVALGGFFGNIHTSQENSSQGTLTISFEGDTTYAAACTAGQTPEKDKCEAAVSSSDATKMYNGLIDALNIVLGIITAIISPAIMFAGWLMSPDWTSGDLFGLRTPMYSLWVTVSNIVYFIYAILLILIALGTMFGQDKFSYKVMLPKLALGILMVPFTWWFVQWTISIASVVTASVISIPAETMKSKDGKSWADTPSVPTEIVINETPSDPTTKKPIVTCANSKCISPTEFLTKSSGMYGYMMVYAYSIFKFQEVKELQSGTDMIKAGVGIVHQGIVAAIMFLVFGLLTLALVAMLLVRAIKLWVYAIFSPLFTFRFVAGSNLMGSDSSDSFTIKEFIGLAFVPAIVGLSLSFGLILINAVSSSDLGSSQKKCTTITGSGCELVSIMGNPENTITRKITGAGTPNAITENIVKFGGITMTFKGVAGSGKDPATVEGSTDAVTGVLNSAGGIFGTLIIDIIALVFIWMAFMAAKNVSKAVSMAVQPFEDMGKKIGSLATSIPKYTPIPGLGMSASGLGKAVGGVETAMIRSSDHKYEESSIGKFVNNMSNATNADEMAKVRKALENHGEGLKSVTTDLRKTGKGENIIHDVVDPAIAGKDKIRKETLEKEYPDGIGTKIYELIQKGDKITPKEKYILAAWLSGNTDRTLSSENIAKAWLKDKTGAGTGTPSATPTPLTVNINSASTTDSIAGELKGKGVTEIQLTEALKNNPTFKNKVDEILKKIKDLEEPPAAH